MNEQNDPPLAKESLSRRKIITLLAIIFSPAWLPAGLWLLAEATGLCLPLFVIVSAMFALPFVVLTALWRLWGFWRGTVAAIILFIPLVFAAFLFGWGMLDTCKL